MGEGVATAQGGMPCIAAGVYIGEASAMLVIVNLDAVANAMLS
jgi:hypothetical protein